jgi:TolB protein
MDAGLALSDIRVIGLTHGRATIGRLGALLVAVTLVGSACSPSNPEPSPTPVGVLFPSSAPTASPAPSAASSPARTPTATLALPDRPLASVGQIAVVRDDGSLWLTDAGGRPTILASGDAGTFGFPTWSPDGSQIAAVQTSFTEATILVFDVDNTNSQPAPTPRAVFRSATIAPFYLSWTPDGKDVSFLASDAESLKLWLAPADGSAPLDGSGPGAVVRAGNPFYFDWIDEDHLFAHIGTGADAFLGEIGRDGVAIGKALRTPGVFRSADVSADGKYVGYVRAGTSGKDAVVVTTRNGADEHSMPVFGLSAVDFSPVDDTLASIGAVEATTEPVGVPAGPLRLIDARTGAVRSLLDGPVVSFAWSPDGKTIAAIGLVRPPDGSAVSSTSPEPSAAPDPGVDVRMWFVDVATGDILSDPQVLPGDRYVRGLMEYFDQYALSHRLWAPDSSSILLPQSGPDGTTHIDVFFPDGGQPVPIDGDIGFWSP